MSLQDITFQRFGRLVALEHVSGNKWMFQCDCGNTVIAYASNVKRGYTKSCGCYRKKISSENIENWKRTHGLSAHPLYRVWQGIKQRCTNPNIDGYKNYGGRGITFCKEWENFMAFYKWAVESGYQKGLSIDRIDVNGNYEPNNCRWIPVEEQAGNKRNNVMITFGGATENAEKLSLQYGYSRSFFSSLARGKTKEEADAIVGEYIRKAREEMLGDGVLGDWISVADKLPENGQRVLACGKQGSVVVCRFDKDEQGVRFVTHESRHMSISYWMPLPKIPKRVGSNYEHYV